MHKKFFIGLFLTAIVGMVAGEYLFNRSGAQDVPKTAEPEKKDTPPAFPLPPLVNVPQPPLPVAPKTDVPALPQLPPMAAGAKPPVVAQPMVPEKLAEKLVDPPAGRYDTPGYPKQAFDKLVDEKAKTKPELPKVNDLPSPVSQPKPPVKETLPPVENVAPVQAVTPPKDAPKPAQTIEFPPAQKPAEKPMPRIGNDAPPTFPPPVAKDILPTIPPAAGQKPPAPPIAATVAKLKNCPWTLQVEMVDGQTIVTATVNKKHEFKIVCKTLDLQTGEGVLKASGKVQISGDALNGTCDQLTIPLLEDRLLLNGTAEVRIQKLSGNVSDTDSAAFELKGESLNLRISELQSGTFHRTSLRKANVDVNVKQATITTTATKDKQWSPYGKLVQGENKVGPAYYLEDNSGRTILELVTREGGSLTQYVGQTISVFGTNERTPQGRSVLRVTHIALP